MFSKKNLIIAIVACSGLFAQFAHADATIQVDSTADTYTIDGHCDLREAILNANLVAGGDLTGGDCSNGSATGVDTITFSAPMTITLGSDLIISSRVFIDGITGTGSVCSTKELKVIISGAYLIDLDTSSSSSTVRGLNIQGGGIRVQESSGTKIQCNMIGLDATGLIAVGGLGVQIAGGSNHIIGGSLEGDGNVVSGNNTDVSGISINGGDGFVVKGNIVGLDKNGDVAMLTQRNGMVISGDVTNLAIGGPGEFERNIISGNYSDSVSQGVLFMDGTMSGITIQNNYIGTDITGMFARPNRRSGVDFCDAVGCLGQGVTVTDLLIGGTGANERNIFSGNEFAGLSLKAADNYTIEGNYFGLDALGTGIIPNLGDGVELERDYDGIIGGATSAARNYFVGNADNGSEGRGLHVLNYLGTSLSVMGNYLGLDINGDVLGAFNESNMAVEGMDLSGVVIGGTGAGEGNVFAGGLSDGLRIAGPGARIFGNKIGTDASGHVVPGYGNDTGIMISSSGNTHEFIGSNVKIGGINLGEANIIAGNNTAGVVVLRTDGEVDILSVTGNSILGNNIFSNNNNGVDHLYFDGMTDPVFGSTANDAGDTDTGPNNFLNHPVINSVNTTTGDVAYTLDVPTGNYRVEFYKNPTSGTYGEGEVFLDSDTFVSTGNSKRQTKTLSLNPGDFVTASATECTDNTCTAFLSTSEFSQAYVPIGTVHTGGGGSIGTQFACHDPQATNYNPFGVSNPSLCKYPATFTSAPIIPGSVATVTTTCPAFVSYYRSGDKGGQITLIQKFLNKELGLQLIADGAYGPSTTKAVRQFQQKYFDYIIKPWNPPLPMHTTGRWYKTTAGTANILAGCEALPVVLEDTGVTWKFDGVVKAK